MTDDRRPFTPEIKLSEPKDRRPCCGVLKIQTHMPDCTGEVSPRRGARRA